MSEHNERTNCKNCEGTEYCPDCGTCPDCIREEYHSAIDDKDAIINILADWYRFLSTGRITREEIIDLAIKEATKESGL